MENKHTSYLSWPEFDSYQLAKNFLGQMQNIDHTIFAIAIHYYRLKFAQTTPSKQPSGNIFDKRNRSQRIYRQCCEFEPRLITEYLNSAKAEKIIPKELINKEVNVANKDEEVKISTTMEIELTNGTKVTLNRLHTPFLAVIENEIKYQYAQQILLNIINNSKHDQSFDLNSLPSIQGLLAPDRQQFESYSKVLFNTEKSVESSKDIDQTIANEQKKLLTNQEISIKNVAKQDFENYFFVKLYLDKFFARIKLLKLENSMSTQMMCAGGDPWHPHDLNPTKDNVPNFLHSPLAFIYALGLQYGIEYVEKTLSDLQSFGDLAVDINQPLPAYKAYFINQQFDKAFTSKGKIATNNNYLHTAIIEDQPDCVAFICELFIKFNNTNNKLILPNLCKTNYHGRTPLILAVIHKRYDIVQLMINFSKKHDVDFAINATDKSEMAAIHYAIQNADNIMLSLLCDFDGINLLWKDQITKSPLEHIARLKDSENFEQKKAMLQILQQKNIDLNTRVETSINIGKYKNNPSIKDKLFKALPTQKEKISCNIAELSSIYNNIKTFKFLHENGVVFNHNKFEQENAIAQNSFNIDSVEKKVISEIEFKQLLDNIFNKKLVANVEKVLLLAKPLSIFIAIKQGKCILSNSKIYSNPGKQDPSTLVTEEIILDKNLKELFLQFINRLDEFYNNQFVTKIISDLYFNPENMLRYFNEVANIEPQQIKAVCFALVDLFKKWHIEIVEESFRNKSISHELNLEKLKFLLLNNHYEQIICFKPVFYDIVFNRNSKMINPNGLKKILNFFEEICQNKQKLLKSRTNENYSTPKKQAKEHLEKLIENLGLRDNQVESNSQRDNINNFDSNDNIYRNYSVLRIIIENYYTYHFKDIVQAISLFGNAEQFLYLPEIFIDSLSYQALITKCENIFSDQVEKLFTLLLERQNASNNTFEQNDSLTKILNTVVHDSENFSASDISKILINIFPYVKKSTFKIEKNEIQLLPYFCYKLINKVIEENKINQPTHNTHHTSLLKSLGKKLNISKITNNDHYNSGEEDNDAKFNLIPINDNFIVNLLKHFLPFLEQQLAINNIEQTVKARITENINELLLIFAANDSIDNIEICEYLITEYGANCFYHSDIQYFNQNSTYKALSNINEEDEKNYFNKFTDITTVIAKIDYKNIARIISNFGGIDNFATKVSSLEKSSLKKNFAQKVAKIWLQSLFNTETNIFELIIKLLSSEKFNVNLKLKSLYYFLEEISINNSNLNLNKQFYSKLLSYNDSFLFNLLKNNIEQVDSLRSIIHFIRFDYTTILNGLIDDNKLFAANLIKQLSNDFPKNRNIQVIEKLFDNKLGIKKQDVQESDLYNILIHLLQQYCNSSNKKIFLNTRLFNNIFSKDWLDLNNTICELVKNAAYRDKLNPIKKFLHFILFDFINKIKPEKPLDYSQLSEVIKKHIPEAYPDFIEYTKKLNITLPKINLTKILQITKKSGQSLLFASDIEFDTDLSIEQAENYLENEAKYCYKTLNTRLLFSDIDYLQNTFCYQAILNKTINNTTLTEIIAGSLKSQKNYTILGYLSEILLPAIYQQSNNDTFKKDIRLRICQIIDGLIDSTSINETIPAIINNAISNLILAGILANYKIFNYAKKDDFQQDKIIARAVKANKLTALKKYIATYKIELTKLQNEINLPEEQNAQSEPKNPGKLLIDYCTTDRNSEMFIYLCESGVNCEKVQTLRNEFKVEIVNIINCIKEQQQILHKQQKLNIISKLKKHIKANKIIATTFNKVEIIDIIKNIIITNKNPTNFVQSNNDKDAQQVDHQQLAINTQANHFDNKLFHSQKSNKSDSKDNSLMMHNCLSDCFKILEENQLVNLQQICINSIDNCLENINQVSFLIKYALEHSDNCQEFIKTLIDKANLDINKLNLISLTCLDANSKITNKITITTILDKALANNKSAVINCILDIASMHKVEIGSDYIFDKLKNNIANDNIVDSLLSFAQNNNINLTADQLAKIATSAIANNNFQAINFIINFMKTTDVSINKKCALNLLTKTIASKNAKIIDFVLTNISELNIIEFALDKSIAIKLANTAFINNYLPALDIIFDHIKIDQEQFKPDDFIADYEFVTFDENEVKQKYNLDKLSEKNDFANCENFINEKLAIYQPQDEKYCLKIDHFRSITEQPYTKQIKEDIRGKIKNEFDKFLNQIIYEDKTLTLPQDLDDKVISKLWQAKDKISKIKQHIADKEKFIIALENSDLNINAKQTFKTERFNFRHKIALLLNTLQFNSEVRRNTRKLGLLIASLTTIGLILAGGTGFSFAARLIMDAAINFSWQQPTAIAATALFTVCALSLLCVLHFKAKIKQRMAKNNKFEQRTIANDSSIEDSLPLESPSKDYSEIFDSHNNLVPAYQDLNKQRIYTGRSDKLNELTVFKKKKIA